MINIKEICPELQEGDDGIWYAAQDNIISYPDKGHSTYYSIEEKSFWFRHRNNCIIALAQTYPPRNDGIIYDIGGGNGYVSLGLAQNGFKTVLVEPGRNGAMNAKARGVEQVICSSFANAGFLQKSLPAIGLFDVLEHIEDDFSFLQSIHSLLSGGGKLYLTVPAYSFLWSAEDVLAKHYRRYSLKSISKKLKQAGFQIDYASYIFKYLPLPIFFLRTLPFKLNNTPPIQKKNMISSEHMTEGHPLKYFLEKLLATEIDNIKNKSPMNFGGSCILSARCS